MSTQSSYIIRDGLEHDIPTCTALDAAYDTDHVWQMSIQHNIGQQQITFKTEHLPRTMRVQYKTDERRLRMTLPAQHCFIVASHREEKGLTIGFLAMRQEPAHKLAVIQDIVVHEPYRRQQIGTRLLNVARKWAHEHTIEQLLLETQSKNYPAIQFCEKNGLSFCGFNDQYFQNQDIAIFFGQSL